ncbi:MAG: hypothetical protein ACUZ8E_17915 [Candidatus Anammoxibacter sp.]
MQFLLEAIEVRKSNDLTIQSAMHGATKNLRLKTLKEVREERKPQKLDDATTDALDNKIKEMAGGR